MQINVEERVELAQNYFKQGYNCTQAVVLAFQDILGTSTQTLEMLTIGLGGGVSRLREVCGTVLAMAVVSGAVSDTEGKDLHQKRAVVYGNMQQMAASFRQEHGSIVCRELLGLKAGEKQEPVPQIRDASFYHSRPCFGFVGSSARIIAEFIQNSYITQK